MQFLSVHNSLHWSEKIANVKALVSKHSVAALSETHISDGVSAETLFLPAHPSIDEVYWAWDGLRIG